eukprot:2885371-Alexandrium_andersonii.AAC.1
MEGGECYGRAEDAPGAPGAQEHPPLRAATRTPTATGSRRALCTVYRPGYERAHVVVHACVVARPVHFFGRYMAEGFF